jgi:hypothetical protein
MVFITLIRLFVIVALLKPASALGINCQGSSVCGAADGNVAQDLTNYINGIDQNRRYANGQQIACIPTRAGGYCAFLQNTGGALGRDILRIAHYIPEHGCRTCGSVPYFYPSDNDVSHGELTYNYVDHGCGQGLCP